MHHRDLAGIYLVRPVSTVDLRWRLNTDIGQTGDTGSVTALLAKYRPRIVVDADGVSITSLRQRTSGSHFSKWGGSFVKGFSNRGGGLWNPLSQFLASTAQRNQRFSSAQRLYELDRSIARFPGSSTSCFMIGNGWRLLSVFRKTN